MGTLNTFQQDMANAHQHMLNALRASETGQDCRRVGIQALHWSSRAAQLAQMAPADLAAQALDLAIATAKAALAALERDRAQATNTKATGAASG